MFKKWLIIGVLIRFALMPITLHPDLWGHVFTSYFFAYEGVLNPYEHLASLPANHPLVANFGVSDIFIYPPLTYYTFGIFRLLVKPFIDPAFIPWLMQNVGESANYPNIGLIIFLFKLPYLFVDLAAGFLLAKLFDKKENAARAFAFWMLNPVTLYATFMMGQFDILPALFTILAALMFKREKYLWAAVSLGVGGSYKIYPLLLLVPLVFLIRKGWLERLKIFLAGLTPFVLTTLPFMGSSAFRQMVLFSPKNQKMLFMGWNLTAAEVIYPFILMLTLIYWLALYRKKVNINILFLAILLLIFSVTHYHPQWFVWVSPFLIWELVKNKYVNLPISLAIFASWIFIVFSFEPSLNVGLFKHVLPALGEFKGFETLVSQFSDFNQLKSIVRSVAAGSSVFLIYRNFNA